MQHALGEENKQKKKKEKNVYGVVVGNAEGRKSLRITRRKWEDISKMDLR
jgi:hypothetical protein